MTTPPARLRALVVDDEPIARAALRALIGEVTWLEWSGEAVDGDDAIAQLQATKPDLVFLDVQMPGATGLEVLSRTSTDAAVIFTTAHDEYAMIAFELGAIDYLRKPFGRERFLRAVERAQPFLDARARAQAHAAPDTEPALTDRLAAATSAPKTLTRLFVRDRGRVVPVLTADIVRCEADGDYVAVITPEKRYLVYVNLTDLATRLDPERFVRVHRSHIVNLDRVAALAPHDANRLEVRFVDGTRIVASRTGTLALRSRTRS